MILSTKVITNFTNNYIGNKVKEKAKYKNREISQKRIVVEHVFASMKRCKIIGSLYRDNLKKLPKIINIIAGIHNLNIK